MIRRAMIIHAVIFMFHTFWHHDDGVQQEKRQEDAASNTLDGP
jgi:hypothetical protein